MDWHQVEISNIRFSKRAKAANVNITAFWYKIDFVIKNNFNVLDDMYNIGFIFDQDRVREKSALYYIDHKAINKIVKE